jgi:hypothetical protein
MAAGLRGISLSKDVLARVVVTTAAVIAFALLLTFDRDHIDRRSSELSTDLSASRR